MILHVATSFRDRLWGRMGRTKSFSPLYIPRCRHVHTCFMRQRIHLVWVSALGTILRIDPFCPPWKYYRHPSAFGVIEFPETFDIGTLEKERWIPLPRIRDFRNPQGGQAVLELALILPFLLLVVLGFFQLSLALSASQKLQHHTYHALTVGSLTNDDQKIQGALTSSYPSGAIRLSIESFDQSSLQPIPSSRRQYQDHLTLQAVQDYPLSIPFFSSLTIPLRSRASSPILCQNPSPPYSCP